MICSSVNRFRFLVNSPPLYYRKTHPGVDRFMGGGQNPNFQSIIINDTDVGCPQGGRGCRK